MINGLKLPVQVISGQLCDNLGNVLIKANRELGTTPLSPSDRDDLIYLVAELLNREFPVLGESIKGSFVPLNEAQLGDKVSLKGERGYIIGQTSDKQWIVQVQGSTRMAKDKEVKVISGLSQNTKVKPPMKFDEITQKLLFEQFIKCGIYYGSVPVKIKECYIRYSDYIKANDDSNVNVLIEGDLTILPKKQVRLFEDPNIFANPQDYVDAVRIDKDTKTAVEAILVHAGDYSMALGESDPVKVILNPNTSNQSMEFLPKEIIRTIAV